MDGFKYNGRHCSEFGVWYVPDAKDLWMNSPDYDITSTKVKGRAGSYYYTNEAKERTFTLSCFFEDITWFDREQIRHWIDRKTSGELVFDYKPFVYYKVRPTKLDTGKVYVTRGTTDQQNRYSGTFSITFTAYEPFGYMTYKSFTTYDDDNASIYCGILDSTEMPAEPTVSSRSFLIYNCGTEVADTTITIGGSAPNGLTITNATNNSVCSLISLPLTDYLTIDSAKGTVRYGSSLAFQYHNDGFIRLDPYLPDKRDIVVSYMSGSNMLTVLSEEADHTWIGRYVRINNEWVKIINVNANGVVTLQKSMGASGTETTRLVTMNEISISGTEQSQSTLTFDFVPVIS